MRIFLPLARTLKASDLRTDYGNGGGDQAMGFHEFRRHCDGIFRRALEGELILQASVAPRRFGLGLFSVWKPADEDGSAFGRRQGWGAQLMAGSDFRPVPAPGERDR